MDDRGEDVTSDVKFLGNPDLFSAFVNDGILMRVNVGSVGADGRFEEVRIKADVIDRCGDRSGDAGDDGSRKTRWWEGVGDVDVNWRFVLLVTVRVRNVCEEQEIVVVKGSEELRRRGITEKGGRRAGNGRR